MSTVRESQPAWAMVSAEKMLGMASQPLTTAWPCFHRVLIRFSSTSDFLARAAEKAIIYAGLPNWRANPARDWRRASMRGVAVGVNCPALQPRETAMKLYMHPASTTSRAVMLFVEDEKIPVDLQQVDIFK